MKNWQTIAFSQLISTRRAFLAGLVVLLSAGVYAADTAPNNNNNNGAFDWQRARAIHQKEQGGEKLSADDQAYLDRAKELMRGEQGPRQAATQQAGSAQAQPAGKQRFGDLDPQKARTLLQKFRRGETLTSDEQAYLEKARVAMQQRPGAGGRKGQGRQGQGQLVPTGKPAITDQPSTGLVPLTNLTGDRKYKGFDGGLYGGGSNAPPASQLKAAAKMAAKVVPLDGDGKPSPAGKAVLMSIGMSNTTMEFSAFKNMADSDSQKAPSLLIVDSAQGSKDSAAWANVGATGTNPVWDEADRRLRSAGATPQQVEVVWIKQALMGPARFGGLPGHVNQLKKDVENILALAKARYPNLRLAYLSSRMYAGYANTQLNPEPYAYESAFAMRGVILDQIKESAKQNGDTGKGAVKSTVGNSPVVESPVVLWGPYLWADGVKGRAGDDLVYKREDLGADGTHPSASGRQKVATLLLNFFKSDPTATPWFVGSSSETERAKPVQSAAATPATSKSEVAWLRDDAAHLLRRAGFGGTPLQIDRLHAMGRDAAVDYLLTGTLPAGAAAPFDHVELPALPDNPKIDYRLQGPELYYELQELRAWWLDRMVRSDRPLEEKMTLFWHGLFCSGVRETKSVQALAGQNQLFRREAIGNYKRLTQEIIHDPAMIRYLNNDENLKGRPNENLARELMELFTMGEGKGYTEADIPAVARALTGVTANRFGDTSQYLPGQHDDGPKTIFGKTGKFTPDDVPELIFARSEPATYLAGKLWQFYGMPEPSDQDIAAVAAALKNSDWELAPALRTLFTSPSFYSDRCKFAIIKCPAEYEAMTLRLLEEPAQPRVLWAAAQTMQGMGQELFQPPNVKGWPGEERWITSGTLNARNGLAMGLTSGRLGADFFGRGMRAGGGKAAGAKAKSAASTTPAGAKADPQQTAADRRFAQKQAIREEQAEQVRAKLAKMPPILSVNDAIVPSRLLAGLGKEASASQVVDAAAARFLQRPLTAKEKEPLVQALGSRPVSLGSGESDYRVRQMFGMMLSLPEYQVE